MTFDVQAFLSKTMLTIPPDDDPDEKWMCGKTEAVVGDALLSMYRIAPGCEQLPLKEAWAAVDGSHELAVVHMSHYEQPCHIMMWIITKTTAYTLQSWVNEVPPQIWSMPLDTFNDHLKTLAVKNVADSEYRLALHALTRIGVATTLLGAKPLNFQMALPVLERRTDCICPHS